MRMAKKVMIGAIIDANKIPIATKAISKVIKMTISVNEAMCSLAASLTISGLVT